MSLPSGFQLLAVLGDDGESMLVRVTDASGRRLLRLPAVPGDAALVASALARFARAVALRPRLEAAWAVLPIAILSGERPALILSDPGGALLQRQPGGLSPGAFLEVARAAAEAVAGVHGAGLVHQDIKPTHLLWNADEKRVRLTGFGIAAAYDAETASPTGLGPSSSLEFMAPERTGRMDRAADARSDLYSLGITLYELATGAAPFVVASPSEWAHAHLARPPLDPREHQPQLSAQIAKILLKLIAKAPDDRYQSARGLAADLERCLDQWWQTGEVKTFPLGTRDVAGRFVPRQVHGRTSERRALRKAFADVVSTGKARLFMIAGEGGSGKSTLAHEAREEMDRVGLTRLGEPSSSLCGHRFAAGKFEQDRGEVPHTAIVQALDGLVRQILTEPEAELATWRQEMSAALAPNAAVVVDWLPVLGHLVGRPEAPPSMPAHEAQNRFFATTRKLIEVLARRTGPLLIFLDDLQWLDPGSADLLGELLSPELGPVLFVGAYRRGEAEGAARVGSEHPLARAVAQARQRGMGVDEVVLAPLSVADLAGLVGEVLALAPAPAETLARVLHQRGGGSPFFSLQLLQRWRDEGLLFFDDATGQWRWEQPRLEAEASAGDATGVLIETLLRFGAPTRAALSTLAAFGSSASIAALGQVLGARATKRSSPEAAIADAEAALAPALSAGLIARTRSGHAFVHDRIREAAYALVPDAERAALHLAIARARDADPEVFLRANHYNRALALVTDADERRLVQRLNQEAGRKAKQASAFASARGYFAHARELLASDAWSRAYDDTRALIVELAECTFLSGDLDGGDALLQEARAQSRTALDALKVDTLRVALFQTLGRFREGLAIGRAALEGLGLRWFDSIAAVQTAFAEESARHQTLRQGRTVAALADLPAASNAEAQALIALVADLTPALYLARSPSMGPLILRCVNETLAHGLTPQAANIVADYALMLAAGHQHSAALEWADLAVALNQRAPCARYEGRVHFIRSCLVMHWRRPFAETLREMEQAFEQALQVGDLAFVDYVGMGQVGHWTAAGRPLAEIAAVADHALASTRNPHNASVHEGIRLQRQFVACLKGRTKGPTSFSDDAIDEAASEAIITAGAFESAVTGFHVLKSIVAFIHGRYAEAASYSEKAASRLQALMASAIGAVQPFFHALIAAALVEDDEAPGLASDRRAAAHSALDDALAALRPMVADCPENFLCRQALLEAERARLDGRVRDAMRGYETAIASARQHDLVLYECIACEAAARFHRAAGLSRLATRYLRATRAAYARWGADAKLVALARAQTTSSSTAGVAVDANDGSEETVGRRRDDGAGDGGVDLTLVMSTSQAVSEQMVPERLIETLLTGVLAVTGAGRAALLVPGISGCEIAGDARRAVDGQITVRTGAVPVSSTLVAESVLRQAFALESRVLGAAALEPGLRAQDEYLQARPGVTALCQPLTQQGALVGMFYLEAAHELPPDRLTALGLLAAQGAISLQNARLYSDLVEERSRLQAIIQQVPAGLIIAEAPSGRIIVVNDEGRRLLRGLLRQDAQGERAGAGEEKDSPRAGEVVEPSWFLPEGWPL
ncbi:MAG TPA: AAA family ATPase, partial [Polyangia bacterium]